MNTEKPEKKGRDLTDDEKKEMRMGQELYEMTQSFGWKTVFKWLEERAYHSWVDPRGMDEEKWKFAELGAFFSADAAKQLIQDIQRAVDRAEYLGKVASGEIVEGERIRIGKN